MIKEFAAAYFERTKDVLDSIDLDKLEQVVELMLATVQQDKQIFVFGNGGSAAASSHFLCDINKGVSLPLDRKFRVICLNDNVPILTAYANDISYEEVFVGQLRNFLDEGDMVIGVSGSGNSPNVLKAMEYARSKRAHTVGITGFDGGKLARIADVSIIAKIHDMQHTEDMQTVLTHVIMRILCLKLHALKAAA